MKNFLNKTSLFVFAVMLLLLSVEMFFQLKPSTFNLKAKYIKHNKDIEVLLLGASQVQNGINPEYLSLKAANLAYGGQDYKMDSALFFNYIGELGNLKYLVLDLCYHTLEKENNSCYFRNSWYYIYHDIDYFEMSFLEKHSLYFSSRKFFNNYLISVLIPGKYKYHYNNFGFVTNDYPGVFRKLSYDSLRVEESANERLRAKYAETSLSNFNRNVKRLNSIIDYCVYNNIKVVLLKPPVYKTYKECYVPSKNKRRLDYINGVLLKDSVLLVDCEQSSAFEIVDYKNDNHLNPDGAKKLSLILDDIMMNRNNLGD